MAKAGRPIITRLDTPGAYREVDGKERGQAVTVTGVESQGINGP
jgi:acetyl-CoA carboxylase alpha subunit